MAAEWFYQVRGRQLGPVVPAELRRLADTGIVTPDALVCRATATGTADGHWILAERVQGLFRSSNSPSVPTAFRGNPRPTPPPPPPKIPAVPSAAPRTVAAANLPAHSPDTRQVRPWIRLWARIIDTGIVSLAIAFPVSFLMLLIVAVIIPFLSSGTASVLLFVFPVILGTVLLFVYCFIEPIFFAVFGTTPGKALLGIDVRTQTGGRLSYSQAMRRSLRVWFYGLGMGINIVVFITLLVAQHNLTHKKIATWDRLGNFRVVHRRIGVLRGTIATVSIVVLFLILAALRGS